MDNSVPVVVINGHSGHGALGVARSLGRLGIQTHLVSPKKQNAVTYSRYWASRFWWDFTAPQAETVQFLLDIGRRIGSRPILIALPDFGAILIEDNATALRERFNFPKASPPLVRTLTNKWQMYLAAKAHGIPTPEVVYPQSRIEIMQYLEMARFPVVIKGADQTMPRSKSNRIVYNRADLLETYDRSAAVGKPNLIFQEYIPGSDSDVWMCNAYFGHQSECLAILTGRKLRQYPAYTGVASLAICLPNAKVEDSTRRFMQGVGYEGLLDVGYRYDARDGLFKVLDVNPRVGGAFRLFLSENGMDVVRACYLHLTDQPIPPFIPSIGRKWLLEEDFQSALRYARDGKLTFKQWLSSLRGIRELHYFAADDPRPILAWLWIKFKKAVVGTVRRIQRIGRITDDLAATAQGP